MKESGLWQYLRKVMTGKWDVTRIESSSGNGVPDVSFGVRNTNGWMELKYIPTWPKRSTTPVKLPLTPEQRLWIRRRGQISGSVWVLCRIEDMFFLLNHDDASEACDGWTKSRWYECEHCWESKIDFSILHRILQEEG